MKHINGLHFDYEDKVLTAEINMSMEDIYLAEKKTRLESSDHRAHDRVVNFDGKRINGFGLLSFSLAPRWIVQYRTELPPQAAKEGGEG